jgi:hypothetical protein
VTWAETPLAPLAREVARDLGRVGLLAGDLRAGDARVTTLSVADRALILTQALASLEALDARGLDFTRSVVATCEPILRDALAAVD